jgi:hypothetical protein
MVLEEQDGGQGVDFVGVGWRFVRLGYFGLELSGGWFLVWCWVRGAQKNRRGLSTPGGGERDDDRTTGGGGGR